MAETDDLAHFWGHGDQNYQDMLASVGNARPEDRSGAARTPPPRSSIGLPPPVGVILPQDNPSAVNWWNHAGGEGSDDVLPRSHSDPDIRAGTAPPPPLGFHLERANRSYWMIGVGVLISIALICELIQTGGIAAVSSNPLIGPDESTLLQMGAKYGPAIIDGEWHRFLTATVLQNGAVTYVLSLLFLRVCASVEQRAGYWLACLVFFLTGIYGFVLSCIFVPELVSCGTTGAIVGYFAVDIVHVIAAWSDEERPCRSLIGRLALIALMVIVGLTPFLDNFMHLGGIIMGLLSAVMLLPNMEYSPVQGIVRSIVALVAFPLTAVVFMLSIVIFFRSSDAGQTWCKSCVKATCIQLFNWCKNA